MVTKVEEYIKARQAENAPTTTTPTAKEQIRSRNENIRAETMGNTAISGQQNVKTEPKVATPTPVTTQPPKTPEMTKAEQSKPQNNLVGNRDVRQEIFTRNRLAGTATGEAVVRGVMEGKIGNDELEYIQQTNPQLYQDYLASRKTQKDLTMVNTPLAGRFDFGGDEELSGALSILGQIQQDAISRMASLAGTIDRSQLYDEYLNTPELQEKETKFNEIQKEAMELRNTMANTLDDVRSEYEGKASESYIQAVAAKRNAVLQKRLDQIEDDLWFAQTDYNSALSSAERKFGFELADRQEEVARQEQLIQTQLNMNMQQFQMGWEVLMKEKENEMKEYWNQKDLEQKIGLMQLEQSMGIEKAEELMKLEKKYADLNGYSASDLIELDNGMFWNAKTGELHDPLNQGNTNGFYGTGTVYTDMLGTVTAYGSETEINGKKVGWKRGLDIAGEAGSVIPTAFSGTVKVGNDEDGFGQYVKITMDDGSTVQYSHLGAISVKDGQRIQAGDVVGTMGNTGFTIPINGGDGTHVDITMKKPGGGYYTPQEVEKLHNMQSGGVPVQDFIKGASPIINLATSERQKGFNASLKYALDNGDKELAVQNLISAYESSLSAEAKKPIQLRATLGFELETLRDKMLEYRQQGGDFGIFTGTKEDVLNRIGQTSDQKLKEIQTQMYDILDRLARSRTGAALTESEEAFYQRLLPGIGKDMDNNMSTIDGLIESMKTQDKALKYAVASRISDDLATYLFGSDPDFLEDLGITVPKNEDVNTSEIDIFLMNSTNMINELMSTVPKMPSF